MNEDGEEIKCEICGNFFDKTTGKEINLVRIKHLEDEEIIGVISVCSVCANHQELHVV